MIAFLAISCSEFVTRFHSADTATRGVGGVARRARSYGVARGARSYESGLPQYSTPNTYICARVAVATLAIEFLFLGLAAG